MDKDLEQTFSKEDYTKCQQVCEKLLNITGHQGNTNQNHSEKSPHMGWNGFYQKDKR